MYLKCIFPYANTLYVSSNLKKILVMLDLINGHVLHMLFN